MSKKNKPPASLTAPAAIELNMKGKKVHVTPTLTAQMLEDAVQRLVEQSAANFGQAQIIMDEAMFKGIQEMLEREKRIEEAYDTEVGKELKNTVELK